MSDGKYPTVNGVEVLRLPPDGYVVDFDNPDRKYVWEHYLIFGILGPLAFIALCQRFYVKQFLWKGLSLDDCRLPPPDIGLIAFCFCFCLPPVFFSSFLGGYAGAWDGHVRPKPRPSITI